MKKKIFAVSSLTIAVLFIGTYLHLASAHPMVLAYGIGNWIMESGNKHLRWCCGPHDCVKIEKVNVRVTPSGWAFTNPHNGRSEIVKLDNQYVSPNSEYWACFDGGGNLRCRHVFPGSQAKLLCCFWAPQPGV